MIFTRFFSLLIIAMVIGLEVNANESKDVLKKRWPQAEAVISRYHTTISFYFDKETQAPMVLVQDEIDIVPLKGSTIERYCLYDETTSIQDVSFQKNGAKRQQYLSLTGDLESPGVFHSDNKFLKYQVTVDPTVDFYRFRSTKRITGLHFFSRYFFHDALYPVWNRTVNMEVPQWLDLASKTFNFAYFNVLESKEVTPTTTLFKYVGGQIPNVDKSQHMLSSEHTFPHLFFQIKSYTDQSNKKHDVFADLDGFYAWTKDLYKNLQTNREPIGLLVEDITKKCSGRKDSIEAIYYWVQDNIRYIAFEYGLAGLIPEQADVVLTKKYGDCKGMANLLKAMLCEAGFDAHLAWLGTNSLNYDFSMPNTSVCNHMICYLNDNNTDYYLDATQKLNLLGSNSDGIQGKEVLIENGDSCFIRTVPTNQARSNAQIFRANMTLNDTELDGKVTISYNGTKKWSIANQLAQQKSSDRESLLYKYVLFNNNHSIDSLKFSDIGVRDTVFNISYFARAKNQTIRSDKEIYFLPDLFASTTWAGVDTIDIYHIDLDMKTHIESTICAQLTPDMKCISIPSDESYQDGPFSYSINYQQEENTLVYKSVVSIDQVIVHKPDFKRLIEFRKKYQSARVRPLVLRKGV